MKGDEGGRPEVGLIKLGGSLITDKSRPDTPRREIILRLASELRRARQHSPLALVLGHGSGSFGHVAAERYALQQGIRGQHGLEGVTVTQDQAAKLHRFVVSALREHDVPAFSLAPSSFVVARAGRPDLIWIEPLISALDLGLLPVVYGDVVMDKERGVSICSTEALFLALAPALGSRGLFVRRVVWLGETDGVYDQDGATIRSLTTDGARAIVGEVQGAAGTDVTGGMRHRLETAAKMAELGISSWIGNGLKIGALVAALGGETTEGTEILAGR